MKLEDLNDTLEAHAILDLAFRLRDIELTSRGPNDRTLKRVRTHMKDFLPEAVKTYAQIRDAIRAAQV